MCWRMTEGKSNVSNVYCIREQERLWNQAARGRGTKRTKALAILRRVIRKNHSEKVKFEPKSQESKCIRKSMCQGSVQRP